MKKLQHQNKGQVLIQRCSKIERVREIIQQRGKERKEVEKGTNTKLVKIRGQGKNGAIQRERERERERERQREIEREREAKKNTSEEYRNT